MRPNFQDLALNPRDRQALLTSLELERNAEFAANACWLELALTAADLLTWTRALCFTGQLAKAEPATLRYRVLHVAARLSRTAAAGSYASTKTGPGPAPSRMPSPGYAPTSTRRGGQYSSS